MAPSHKDCKDKTGNYQNHEFDWLHWILQIIANHWLFSSNNIYFCKCQKADHGDKKSKEDEQTLEELNSAHRRSQAKCQLIQASYIKRI